MLVERDSLIDVMYSQQLVIDEALDEVEQPPSDKEAAKEQLVRPEQMLPVGGPPQDEETNDDEDVRGAVEDAVPEGVEFQAWNVLDRVPRAEHVVPLEHLVQDDTVEEAPKTEPKKDAGRDGELGRWPIDEGHSVSSRIVRSPVHRSSTIRRSRAGL